MRLKNERNKKMRSNVIINNFDEKKSQGQPLPKFPQGFLRRVASTKLVWKKKNSKIFHPVVHSQNRFSVQCPTLFQKAGSSFCRSRCRIGFRNRRKIREIIPQKFARDDPKCRRKNLRRGPKNHYLSKMAKVSRQQALERILSDLKEVVKNPFETIQVYPIETNIFEWHFVMTAPKGDKPHHYSDIPFHFVMKFPENYPASPPTICPSTSMKHPNVFGSYICCDLIKPIHRDESGKRYTNKQYFGGWTTAYTAYSVLMQLQAFLFDENVPQEYGGVRKNSGTFTDDPSREIALAFLCPTCGFNAKLKPELGTNGKTEMTSKIQELVQNPGQHCYLLDMPTEVILDILDFIPEFKDLSNLSNSSSQLARIIRDCGVVFRKELICFFSKKPYSKETLGVGIHVEWNPKGGVSLVSSSFDMLSYESFVYNHVREGVWGDSFEYFLPLLLSPSHQERAAKLIPGCLSSILQ
jgi:ubiquitin-protein ligase